MMANCWNMAQGLICTLDPANSTISRGMRKGANTIVSPLIAIPSGTSPLSSAVHTAAIPAQGTTPTRMMPVANCGSRTSRRASAQHSSGI